LFYEPKGQRLEFNRESNPKIPLFDLGNNVDYIGLRVGNLTKQPPTLIPNVDDMVGEMITLMQVLVEELAVASNVDGDDE
jgi:hypothetical protein